MEATIDAPAGFRPGPRAAAALAPAQLRDIALAAIAAACPASAEAPPAAEDRLLRERLGQATMAGHSLAAVFARSLKEPADADAALMWIAGALSLTPIEILAVALAAAVEDDALVGRLLAHAQAPLGGSRPTLGLLSRAFTPLQVGTAAALPTLINGNAVSTGLLAVLNDGAPMPERTVMVPVPLALALARHDGPWFGATIGLDGGPPVCLSASVATQATRHAVALESEPHRALVIRTGSPAEGRSVAVEIARALGARPVFIETDKLAGLGPWLLLRKLVPVFCFQLAPGERRALPALPGYRGPMLAVAGPDGAVETVHGAAANWVLPVPSRDERRALWIAGLGAGPLAAVLATEHRHGAGRIAHLSRMAQHQAALAGRREPGRADVLAAAWTGEGSGLDALAEPLLLTVPDEALVATRELRANLAALLRRCRTRDELAAGLGPSARTRYRPGVRALFVGASGTGKTLASGWIASQLGLPMYRVDLASVTSKYIGETEKNLAQLLARAEQAEVVLLFDEADSLFGKRTDIGNSNDRFANAQTNYLLQRIENMDGIILLTSNSQSRLDPGFARRLDFVIEFPAPGAEERRTLWQAHLGKAAALAAGELNQLAALADFSGGHIRNAVLAAAAGARDGGRAIAFSDLVAGVESELRKLGRPLPVALSPKT